MIVNTLLEEKLFWKNKLEEIKNERKRIKEALYANSPVVWIRSSHYYEYRRKIKKLKQRLAKVELEIYRKN